MFHNILFFLLIVSLVAAPSQIHASQKNDLEIKQLRQIFNDYLDSQKSNRNKKGNVFTTEGDLTISPVDHYYSITLPKIISTTGKKQRIILYPVNINAAPAKKQGDWKMSITLPKYISAFNKEGEKTLEMDIGSQKIQAIWAQELQNFSQLNAQFKNISISNPNKNEQMIIKSVEALTKLTKEEEKWSGPQNFTIQDIKIISDKDINISIGSITGNSDIIDYDPQIKNKILGQIDETSSKVNIIDPLRDLITITSNSNTGIKLKDIKVTVPKTLISEKTKLPQRKVDDITKGFVLVNPKSNTDSQNHKKNTSPTSEEKQSFSIEEFHVNIGSSVKANDTNNISFRLGLDKFTHPNLQQYNPINFKLDFLLENTPTKKIADIIDNLRAHTNKNSDIKTQAIQEVMNLQNILLAAETSIKINDMNFNSNQYIINSDGRFEVNLNSSVGVVGNLQISAKNLDKIIQDLENTKQSSDIKTAVKVKSLLKNIKLFQLFSEKDGDTNKLYLKIAENGNITINDKDIISFLGTKRKNAPEPIELDENSPFKLSD